jgi:hypothetical protein
LLVVVESSTGFVNVRKNDMNGIKSLLSVIPLVLLLLAYNAVSQIPPGEPSTAGKAYQMDGATVGYKMQDTVTIGMEQFPLFKGWAFKFKGFEPCRDYSVQFSITIDSITGPDSMISNTSGVPCQISFENGSMRVGSFMVCSPGIVIRLKKGMSFQWNSVNYTAIEDSCGIEYTNRGGKTFGIQPPFPYPARKPAARRN